MKQGSGKHASAGGKVEPNPRRVSPGAVSEIGVVQVRTEPHQVGGRGFKAPMNKSQSHKSGSQGRH